MLSTFMGIQYYMSCRSKKPSSQIVICYLSAVDSNGSNLDNLAVNNIDQIRQFGLEIKRRRLELGLTQEEFADRSGLHRTYVSGIERGERNPTFGTIFQLASGLNCAPRDLLPGTAAK
jgi:DNA-binding XRE family transcriptional regulator